MEPTIISKSIESKIYFFRGHRVMLDNNLAALYGVETKVLNQAVCLKLAETPAGILELPVKE